MITAQNKETLTKYAEVKKEINRLETLAEDLKIEAIDIMRENEIGEIAIGNDKLTFSNVPTWRFTKKVDQLKKAMDEQKALEKRTGEATKIDGFRVTFFDSDNKKAKYVQE
jgi:hypothetical protein